MKHETTIELSLILKVGGDHKNITPEEALNYLKPRGLCEITDIGVKGVTVKNFKSTIDQPRRTLNILKKLIKDAIPKFVLGKNIRATRRPRTAYDMKHCNGAYFVIEIYDQDKSNGRGPIATFFIRGSNCNIKNRINCLQSEDLSIDLKDPDFSEKVREFFGEKEISHE